jgi:hypothetical protein
MDTHARTLFGAAAIFNYLAGVAFLIAMPQFAQLIGMQPLPSDPLFAHFGAVLVLTFGWGYWRTSRDPVANRSIIHLGIVGKSLVVIAGYIDWFLGNTNWPFALLITGDAVFAALFLDYLRRRPIWAA